MGALLFGSSLIILGRDGLLDYAKSKETLNSYPGSINFITTSLFQQLIESCPDLLKTCHQVLFGGEASNVECIKKYLNQQNSPKHLTNCYGPTESTTFTTTYTLRELSPEATTIPIGKPIGNTTCYILDTYLNPVPVGVVGELYIGGDGLARGYLNRPELTAERFIGNPFVSKDDKARGYNTQLYKTGDLCRYLEDGNIEYIGRIDHQVKIRGFRIELGEIENALLAYQGVKEAIVLAREDNPAEKHLAAYLVMPEDLFDASVLRTHLKSSLPEYMVPSLFIRLDAFPLTPNGKLDRKALPLPEGGEIHKVYVAPQTELEQTLCDIWQEVLKVKQVGLLDNFFELGGHSLLAALTVSKINASLSINLSIINLFKYPSPKELSSYIESGFKELSSSPIFQISSKAEEKPLFLIHPGGGSSYCYLKLGSYIQEIPLYGINNPSFDSSEKELSNVEEFASYYLTLIKDIQKSGPYRLGGWSFGGVIAFEMAQQLLRAGEHVEKLVLIDSYNFQAFLNKERSNPHGDERIAILTHEPMIKFLDKATHNIIQKNILRCIDAMSNYVPQLYAEEVHLLKASENSDNIFDNDAGWKHIAPKLKVTLIPGDHYSLFENNLIKSTANAIKKILDK